MTAAAPQEIEAKFLVDEPSQVEPLRLAPSLVPGYDLGEASEITIVDTYLDTPDFRLLRHGYGLRLRTNGVERLLTLKSRRVADTASIYRRTEIEEPLPPDATIAPISNWPSAIVQAMLPLLDGATALRPLCVLHQTRLKRPVTAQRRLTPNRRTAKPTDIGELSLDTVRICTAEESPPLATYFEMEIELAPAVDETELHAIVAGLQANMQLEPSPQSKLEYALTVVGRHPADAPENWQGIQADMHMAEACRLIWREQLTAMLLNEAGVRYSNNPEYVHDMRVATRRARAAAKLYGEYFRPKAIRRFLRDLRETARLLGAVRDLDVAIDKLVRFGARRNLRITAGLDTTLDTWRARRAAAHAALLRWFDSPRYGRLMASFAEFCAATGAGARQYPLTPNQAPVPHQVRHVAPSMILNRFEGVRSFETFVRRDADVPVEALHLLRIECKYLRYNLEFVHNLLGPQAQRLVADLRRLQQRLGDLNDAAVSKRMVAEVQTGGNAVDIERYQRAQDKVIDRLGERVASDFEHFSSHLNRRRLALAIAWI
jgi:triphosphatase